MTSLLLPPGPRTGTIPAPASKSMAHRLLILAALSPHPVTLSCNELSDDIRATAACLSALGATVTLSPSTLSVTPISPSSIRHSSLVARHSLPCGESGSTLRFLIPLVGALGLDATCLMAGRLPQRPLAPFDAILAARGLRLLRDGSSLHLSGALTPGDYPLPGDISSQFVSGLLMALPLLSAPSTVRLTTPLQSAPYVALTLRALSLAG
ncbi:MAG: 3-phosphoshikimate 1-carboxyvinyltransferase, partial [Kiritimatiellae bacterium]|nr:3-phosphoshikimate 1-carboxyvinyltransferase [Kiritimatiellia bacterium]